MRVDTRKVEKESLLISISLRNRISTMKFFLVYTADVICSLKNPSGFTGGVEINPKFCFVRLINRQHLPRVGDFVVIKPNYPRTDIGPRKDHILLPVREVLMAEDDNNIIHPFLILEPDTVFVDIKDTDDLLRKYVGWQFPGEFCNGPTSTTCGGGHFSLLGPTGYAPFYRIPKDCPALPATTDKTKCSQLAGDIAGFLATRDPRKYMEEILRRKKK